MAEYFNKFKQKLETALASEVRSWVGGRALSVTAF